MKLVILETPYAGNIAQNTEYARLCMHDCLLRGEAPMASHLLYTQKGVLNDHIPEERNLGIQAGLAWGSVADETVVYIDKGISPGMEYGIQNAIAANRKISFRKLFEDTTFSVLECEIKYLGKGVFD